ncbi:hypothetical protein [Christensenella intestinihominis]|uniref:hypothetical protein n=1 Tax=Christensenella intestinihominis TaxID=1851429 RepID=UPI00082F658E|nr:hypothetical protein [Christensenella intestinihominis]
MAEKITVALDLMRLEGICKMLLDTINEDELKQKYLFVTGQGKVDNLKSALSQLSKADLYKIIKRSPEISESVIRSYYEEYRYGRKPGFVLYWANKFVGKKINESKLKDQMDEFLGTKHYNVDARFKDLKCIAITKWTEESSEIFEVGLTYLKKYSYITPQNRFDYIHELTDCFVWINVEKGFAALYNMPPTIEYIIRNAILELFDVKLVGLSLNKAVLDTIFNPDDRKKVSLTSTILDENKPQKVTFSDPDLAHKQDSFMKGFEEHEIAAALYNEQIDNDIIATLGVNSNRGKLYINQNLTTSQFRKWSIKRIVTIIDYFSDIFSEDGIEKFSHIQLFSGGEWGHLRLESREILNEIARVILICKQKHVEQYPINISPIALYNAFPKQTAYSYLIVCERCEDTTIPSCIHCQKSIFKLSPKNTLSCESCKESITTVKCVECGTIKPIRNIDEILSIALNDEFLIKIISELQAIEPKLKLADNEYVTVYNGHLRILNAGGYKRLRPKDIHHFKDLYEFTPSVSDIERAKNILRNLGEKCKKHPTTEMCEECRYKQFDSIESVECLQQLFCYFDDFIPQPHQGQEYGDISITINLDGRDQNMQGIMKSENRKITRSSKTGREILDQTLKGLQDVRTEIISIIVPATLDTQLIEALLLLAKILKKKVIILDSDFMIRLTLAYEKKKLV